MTLVSPILIGSITFSGFLSSLLKSGSIITGSTYAEIPVTLYLIQSSYLSPLCCDALPIGHHFAPNFYLLKWDISSIYSLCFKTQVSKITIIGINNPHFLFNFHQRFLESKTQNLLNFLTLRWISAVNILNFPSFKWIIIINATTFKTNLKRNLNESSYRWRVF